MSVHPEFNGLRVKLPGHPEIYLVDGGLRRHIPDPPTYDSLFRNWDGIRDEIAAGDIDIGAPLPHGAVLVQGYGQPEVWLIDNDGKRHVAGPSTMDKYYFDWNKIIRVPPLLLAKVATANQIA